MKKVGSNQQDCGMLKVRQKVLAIVQLALSNWIRTYFSQKMIETSRTCQSEREQCCHQLLPIKQVWQNRASKWWEVERNRSSDCYGKGAVFCRFSGSKSRENGAQTNSSFNLSIIHTIPSVSSPQYFPRSCLTLPLTSQGTSQ